MELKFSIKLIAFTVHSKGNSLILFPAVFNFKSIYTHYKKRERERERLIRVYRFYTDEMMKRERERADVEKREMTLERDKEQIRERKRVKKEEHFSLQLVWVQLSKKRLFKFIKNFPYFTVKFSQRQTDCVCVRQRVSE